MNLHELKPAKGSRTVAKRKGQGIGSGNGKTAGKGHKGQRARSGGGVRPGFEGGQMPLQQRIPKRGFKNKFKTQWAIVNVSDLNTFAAEAIITPEELVEKGIIKNLADGVKILGNGELEIKLTVKANKFTKAAVEKIEALGGTIEVI